MYSTLKELRFKNEYTCADMPKMLKISPAYYSQLENGERRLYYLMAVKISSIFDLYPDDIFYEQYKYSKVRYKVKKKKLTVISYFSSSEVKKQIFINR